jgi:hypothetical protein
VDGKGPPTPKESHKEGEVFSGRFKFADGSIPPKMTFQVIAHRPDEEPNVPKVMEEARRADVTGSCHPWAIDHTDNDGHFAVAGLCPEKYSVVLETFSGLGAVDGVYSVPSQDAEIILGGYLLKVRVVDQDGGMVGESVVTTEYNRDAEPGQEPSAPAHLHVKGDQQGIAFLSLPDPGRCTLRARNGVQVSDDTTIVLQGPSRIVESTLQVYKAGNGAALRVTLHGCAPSNAVITEYCFTILDAKSLTQVARLCSENADADGAFRDLPTGSFVMEVVPRYSGPPSFYVKDREPVRKPVTLVENQEASIDFCLKLGGRISLLITRDEKSAPAESIAHAEAALSALDGTGPRPLSFRETTPDGITVSRAIPFGIRRLSETIIEDGSYYLDVTGDGLTPLRTVVSVHAGEALEVSCKVRGTQ